MLATLSPVCTVIKAAGVQLPECRAGIVEVDFKSRKIKSQDWALAALAVLAGGGQSLTEEMLTAALKLRFNPTVLELARKVTNKAVYGR
jgi:hypothetical protein